MTTGLVIVAAFNAVIAVARSPYENARPEPPFVVTVVANIGTAEVAFSADVENGSFAVRPKKFNASVHGEAKVTAEIVMMMSDTTMVRTVRIRLNIVAEPRAA